MGVKLHWLLAALGASANLFTSACLPGPQCNHVTTPPTVVFVTDGSSPVCGATVHASRIFDDATVNQFNFVEEVGDGGACTGMYENSLDDTGPWTIQVSKAGFTTSTVNVDGPAPIDCNHPTGMQEQRLTVNLTP